MDVGAQASVALPPALLEIQPVALAAEVGLHSKTRGVGVTEKVGGLKSRTVAVAAVWAVPAVAVNVADVM
jgi:hypothetical protein